jgi:hypothetical protein
MVSPKTGRPRGRPQKDFLRDPERFAVALALALTSVTDVSENGAFLVAAALAFGWKMKTEDRGPRRKPGRGSIPGGVWTVYERALSGSGWGTLRGRATSLRQKASRIEAGSDSAKWLKFMVDWLITALRPVNGSSLEQRATRFVELANQVNAEKITEDQLRLDVMGLARLPDLFTNDPPQE